MQTNAVSGKDQRIRHFIVNVTEWESFAPGRWYVRIYHRINGCMDRNEYGYCLEDSWIRRPLHAFKTVLRVTQFRT